MPASSKTKSTVYFDIDHTLLDNNKLHKNVWRHFLKEFKTEYFGKELFALKNYLLLLKNVKVNYDFTDTFLAPKYYKNSLFPDVINTLETLKGKVKLGIFSQFSKNLQMYKLISCNVFGYFNRSKIFVFKKKINHLNTLTQTDDDKTIYLVDDRVEVINKALEKNIIPILIDRKKSARKNTRYLIINSLNQIPKLIC